MDQEVTASFSTLVDQAGETSAIWLRKVVACIDDLFGEGYAKSNPTLVQGMLIATALDQHAAYVKLAGQDIRDALHALRGLTEAVDGLRA